MTHRQHLHRLLPEPAIDAAFTVAAELLSVTGVNVLEDDESLAVLSNAGARVDASGRVRWDLATILDVVSSAPGEFPVHSRDPRLSLTVGGAQPVFAPVYGPPNVIDDDGVRRTATMGHYRQLLDIAANADGLGTTGHLLCVPDDVDLAERDEVITAAHLAASHKPFLGSTTSEAAARRVVAMVDAAFDGIVGERASAAGDGIGHEGRADHRGDVDVPACRLLFLCNSIPPLTWRERMLGVLRSSASTGQASIVTSFQMLGATSPIHVVTALGQGLAEVLIGLALTQLYRPGAPAILGIYGLPFDMRSMAPRAGDPMSAYIQSGCVQIARRVGVPALGYAGVTSSKLDDAQAGSEATFATRSAIDAGADFVLHAAGWLENGRTVSFSKFRREAAALSSEVRPPNFG